MFTRRTLQCAAAESFPVEVATVEISPLEDSPLLSGKQLVGKPLKNVSSRFNLFVDSVPGYAESYAKEDKRSG